MFRISRRIAIEVNNFITCLEKTFYEVSTNKTRSPGNDNSLHLSSHKSRRIALNAPLSSSALSQPQHFMRHLKDHDMDIGPCILGLTNSLRPELQNPFCDNCIPPGVEVVPVVEIDLADRVGQFRRRHVEHRHMMCGTPVSKG